MNDFSHTHTFHISWTLILIAMINVVLSAPLSAIPPFSENGILFSLIGETTLLVPILVGEYSLFKNGVDFREVFGGNFSPLLLPFIVLLPITVQPFINVLTLPANTIIDALFGTEKVSGALPDGVGEWFLAVVTVCLAAPILEEWLCRGIIMRLLAEHGISTALAVSSLGFALLHFSPRTFIVMFFLGLVLGVIRLSTNSLTACIIAHSANNLFALLTENNSALSEKIGTSALAASVAAFPLLLWLFLKLSPRKKRCALRYKPAKSAKLVPSAVLCLLIYGAFMLLLLVMNISEFFTGTSYILH